MMRRVLVIDDDESYREMVITILRQAGFSVLEASNGREGIELAQNHPLDLIVSDVMMGELDGFGVLDRLRMDPATSTIPFIFMTGLSDRESMRRGMTLGADDFLVKPFTGTELLTAVDARLVKHKELTQEAERKLAGLRASISLALPHELRTPLTTILGYSEIMCDQAGSLTAAEIGRLGRSISRAGLSLHRLVENFLVYAQIEVIATDSEKSALLRRGRVSATASLIETLCRNKAQFYNRSADLTLRIADSPAAISEEYLAKICEELLDNAFKFSEAGTAVQVTTSTDKNDFVLSIQDHGRGMSPQQMASLGAYTQFERKFYEQKGTGLGLVIAKRLTELHGGRIEFVGSTGRGLIVLVRLPILPVEEATHHSEMPHTVLISSSPNETSGIVYPPVDDRENAQEDPGAKPANFSIRPDCESHDGDPVGSPSSGFVDISHRAIASLTRRVSLSKRPLYSRFKTEGPEPIYDQPGISLAAWDCKE